ncbi:MAG: hypothetical protein PHI73_03745 [Patescibacteria group bacterium]|nr:hypothetical protein [Patescibacteria group bacterium]
MKTNKTLYTTLAVLIFILIIVIGIKYHHPAEPCVNRVDDSIICIGISGDNNVYTNKQEGYKIKVPRDWSLAPYPDPKTLSFLDSRAKDLSAKDNELTSGMKIEVLSYTVKNYEEADRYIQGKITESRPYIINQKEISVSGHKASQITENALGYQIATFIPNDNTLITIVGYIAEPEQYNSYTAIYDDILGTFQFTDY